MKLKFKIMSIIIIVIISGMLYWLNYISTASPGCATYSIGFTTKTISTFELINGRPDKELKRIDEYAELCDLVYRAAGKEHLDTFLNWKLLKIPMENLKNYDDGKRFIEGLYYEIWELKEQDKTIVAIIFRGTNVPTDWFANFRWFKSIFSRHTWDHYDQLNSISLNLINTIKQYYNSDLGNVQIVAAGHSLGGGLAQFMAYATPEINLVYTFNSSPVTGYYDIKPNSRRNENKKNAFIYRIYESGEALSFARKWMTFLYPAPFFNTKDPAIIRIRFSFSTGVNSIYQHSMSMLAENLRIYKSDKNVKN